jgi:hypothetical protein
VLERVQDPLGKQLDITWQAPDDGGSEITGYQLDVYRNGAKEITRTLEGNTTSDRVAVSSTKDPYTVTVIAINKAGPSGPSATSESVVAFKVPEAIAAVTATDHEGTDGLDGRARLTFTPPDDGGSPITGYQVGINGAGATPYTNSDITVSGLANGQDYTFTVKACNAAGCGAPTTSNQVRPYGPPAAPSLSGNGGSTTLTWNWSPLSAAQANGRDIARYQVSLDGGGWQDDTGTTSWSGNFGLGETHNLRVRAVNTAQQIGAASNTVSLSTPPPPPPPPTLTARWGSADSVTGCTSGCARMVADAANWEPGSYPVRCQVRTSPSQPWNSNFGWTPPNLVIGSNGSGSTGDTGQACVAQVNGAWDYRLVINGMYAYF